MLPPFVSKHDCIRRREPTYQCCLKKQREDAEVCKAFESAERRLELLVAHAQRHSALWDMVGLNPWFITICPPVMALGVSAGDNQYRNTIAEDCV